MEVSEKLAGVHHHDLPVDVEVVRQDDAHCLRGIRDASDIFCFYIGKELVIALVFLEAWVFGDALHDCRDVVCKCRAQRSRRPRETELLNLQSIPWWIFVVVDGEFYVCTTKEVLGVVGQNGFGICVWIFRYCNFFCLASGKADGAENKNGFAESFHTAPPITRVDTISAPRYRVPGGVHALAADAGRFLLIYRGLGSYPVPGLIGYCIGQAARHADLR